VVLEPAVCGVLPIGHVVGDQRGRCDYEHGPFASDLDADRHERGDRSEARLGETEKARWLSPNRLGVN